MSDPDTNEPNDDVNDVDDNDGDDGSDESFCQEMRRLGMCFMPITV